MKRLIDDLHRHGESLDVVHYTKNTPTLYGGYADLGTTFGTRKSATQESMKSESQSSSQSSRTGTSGKFKLAIPKSKSSISIDRKEKVYNKTSSNQKSLSSGDSEVDSDEMNIRPSSPLSLMNNQTIPQKFVKKPPKWNPESSTLHEGSDITGRGKGTREDEWRVHVDKNGKEHRVDPKLDKSKTISGLKFKKNKDLTTKRHVLSLSPSHETFVGESINWNSPPKATFGDGVDLNHESSGDGGNLSDSIGSSSYAMKKKMENRIRPSPSPSPSFLREHRKLRSGSKGQDPRNSIYTSKKQSKPQVKGTKPLAYLLDESNMEQHRSRSESIECSSPIKTRPAPFPALSPMSTPRPTSSFPTLSPLRGDVDSPIHGKTLNFIAGSLSRSPTFSTTRLTTFAKSPPKADGNPLEKGKTANEKSRNKGKGKAVQDLPPSDYEDGYESFASNTNNERRKREKKQNGKIKKTAVESFPMSTQMLQSIGSPTVPSSSPRTSILGSPMSRKRYSDSGCGNEHTPKKTRREQESPVGSPSRLPWEEGFSVTLSPDVNPRTLCPYCDAPLPGTPSRVLMKLLEMTRKRATKDPRPSNPLGLKAPLVTFIAVCQRHRFESQILPEAEKNGWPKVIEWETINERILKMEKLLRAIIEDTENDHADVSDANSDWDVVYKSRTGKKNIKRGAKSSCIFWKEFMEEVKQKGLKAVSGVRGQFENFERTQPGYYGEVGSVIIHQTLYNMFPLTEMDPVLISPLTPTEFVQRILVPEVALRLIMEDKDLLGESGMKEAFQILRDSASYGVAMFPEEGGEKKIGGRFNAGDLIVMERARKRRKELEEEERGEEEKKKSVKEKQKKTRKEEMKSERSESDIYESRKPAEPRPRPRPKQRSLAIKEPDAIELTGSEDMDLGTSTDTGTQTRTRSRSVLSDRSNINDDNLYRSAGQELKRSPSASESRVFVQEISKPPSQSLMTRATSQSMVTRSLDSDSDSSTKAIVEGGKRSRSRTSSSTKGKVRSTRKMGSRKDSDSDDHHAIEIVDHKTPVASRPNLAIHYRNSDETPKASRLKSGLAPLQIARQRQTQENGKKDAPSAATAKLAGKESYSWLLNSEGD